MRIFELATQPLMEQQSPPRGFVEVTMPNGYSIFVSPDYVRDQDSGNYRTFNGLEAMGYAYANNAVVPSSTMAQAIANASNRIVMPTQPIGRTGGAGDPDRHTRAAQQRIRAEGADDGDLVAGHMKDVVQSQNGRLGLWGGYAGEGSGSNGTDYYQLGRSPHDRDEYEDYSQGLRLVHRYARDPQGNLVDLNNPEMAEEFDQPEPMTDARRLQVYLAQAGYGGGDPDRFVDGVFGENTRSQLNQFQRDNNLPITRNAEVDARTLRSLAQSAGFNSRNLNPEPATQVAASQPRSRTAPGSAAEPPSDQWGTMGNFRTSANGAQLDPQLLDVMQEAARRFPLRVRAFSGVRSSRGAHGRGDAIDVMIYDDAGNALSAYQSSITGNVYAAFYEVARQVAQERYPERGELGWLGGALFRNDPSRYGSGDHMDYGWSRRNAMNNYIPGEGWVNDVWATNDPLGVSGDEFLRDVSLDEYLRNLEGLEVRPQDINLMRREASAPSRGEPGQPTSASYLAFAENALEPRENTNIASRTLRGVTPGLETTASTRNPPTTPSPRITQPPPGINTPSGEPVSAQVDNRVRSQIEQIMGRDISDREYNALRAVSYSEAGPIYSDRSNAGVIATVINRWQDTRNTTGRDVGLDEIVFSTAQFTPATGALLGARDVMAGIDTSGLGRFQSAYYNPTTDNFADAVDYYANNIDDFEGINYFAAAGVNQAGRTMFTDGNTYRVGQPRNFARGGATNANLFDFYSRNQSALQAQGFDLSDRQFATQLQTRLRNAGFDPGEIDGRIGSNTLQALNNYVEDTGQDFDRAMADLTNIQYAVPAQVNTRTLRGVEQPPQEPFEPTQNQTRELQNRLNDMGIDVGEVNGVLDSITQRGIEQAQARLGLPPTGQLTRASFDAIVNTPPGIDSRLSNRFSAPTEPIDRTNLPNLDVADLPSPGDAMMQRGSRGNDVRYLQQTLSNMGYDIGETGVDGIYGSQTARAVADFQNDYNLQVDGVVGRQTMGALETLLPVTQQPIADRLRTNLQPGQLDIQRPAIDIAPEPIDMNLNQQIGAASTGGPARYEFEPPTQMAVQRPAIDVAPQPVNVDTDQRIGAASTGGPARYTAPITPPVAGTDNRIGAASTGGPARYTAPEVDIEPPVRSKALNIARPAVSSKPVEPSAPPSVRNAPMPELPPLNIDTAPKPKIDPVPKPNEVAKKTAPINKATPNKAIESFNNRISRLLNNMRSTAKSRKKP